MACCDLDLLFIVEVPGYTGDGGTGTNRVSQNETRSATAGRWTYVAAAYDGTGFRMRARREPMGIEWAGLGGILL
jgi:hypothetical protein